MGEEKKKAAAFNLRFHSIQSSDKLIALEDVLAPCYFTAHNFRMLEL